MWFKIPAVSIGLAILVGSRCSQAISLDINSTQSIKDAASTVAYDMMTYYTGNRTGDVPGNLPDPYFWWVAGAMFGSLIDYWYYTGDTTYNDVVSQAMLHQVGPHNNYMPPNQSKSMGNDDQCFWALSAMRAAEVNFQNPSPSQPQWLALAQAVFNLQAERWDDTTCGGGLRWQIFLYNPGYNYKNSISNGCFFNLASRLAKYTGKEVYVDWAEKTWDWMSNIGLISNGFHNNISVPQERYAIFDGSNDEINCTEIDHTQWTYNAGMMLLGAANMYNITGGSPIWRERVEGILNRTFLIFFDNDIMREHACEAMNSCDGDQRSFKAYLSRWMGATTVMAPFTYDMIMPKLRTSAAAAAANCNKNEYDRRCGLKWAPSPGPDVYFGVGEQMAALEVIQNNLVPHAMPPVTETIGGTSKGDDTAGMKKKNKSIPVKEVTKGDKIKSWSATGGVMLVFVTLFAWMCI